MEAIDDTRWDIVISGTGLPQSLLALALSRSNKKVLHADRNVFYGGAEAALSLQEAEEWAQKNSQKGPAAFCHASIHKPKELPERTGFTSETNLGPSRSYSLALAPQILYARSALLATLVSSKVYRQLEFMAVGSWWVYEANNNQEASDMRYQGILKKIPSGREDVFADTSLDVKSKRSLIKFVRLVTDPEAQAEAIREHGSLSFGDYLSRYFGISSHLQGALHALTLSLDPPSKIQTAWALPRIARHLTSFGFFGPGFNAVIPKWGGSAEIAQVACRAQAVGGGVYMLGRGVSDIKTNTGESDVPLVVSLQDEFEVATDFVAGRYQDLLPTTAEIGEDFATRSISIVSSPLKSFFPSTGENGPVSACSVVAFPHDSFADVSVPIYLILHSSDTGECPTNQTVIYSSIHLDDDSAPELLDQAVHKLLELSHEVPKPTVLWQMRFRQQVPSSQQDKQSFESYEESILILPEPSTDLAFDDSLLEDVKNSWQMVSGETAGFMSFEDREAGAYSDEDEY